MKNREAGNTAWSKPKANVRKRVPSKVKNAPVGAREEVWVKCGVQRVEDWSSSAALDVFKREYVPDGKVVNVLFRDAALVPEFLAHMKMASICSKCKVPEVLPEDGVGISRCLFCSY